MPLLEILLATRNAGKAREFQEMLSGLPVRIRTLEEFPGAPEVDEDGESFEENALKKARILCRWFGGITVADDSGLEVQALGGAPGVCSARYAGPWASDEDNNRKLLLAMAGVAPDERKARFRCLVALVHPDGREWVFEGSCEGTIATEIKGTHGFGYDPLFVLPQEGKTFAEIGPEVKNRVSHRAKALAKLRKALEVLAGG
ncbi:MAG: XTP/dITP diphosphatase [Thermodesulfobacteriota bacterium]